MAHIINVGKIAPLARVQQMLAAGGHTLESLPSITEARNFQDWERYDIALLGEKLTYGERELIAELARAAHPRIRLIFLYEFFIGNPQSADAIVDIALGLEYLPDAIHYVNRREGSIRKPASGVDAMMPSSPLRIG
jgi:hypothetical protein